MVRAGDIEREKRAQYALPSDPLSPRHIRRKVTVAPVVCDIVMVVTGVQEYEEGEI